MPDATTAPLPRWSVADVHESFAARSFLDALERSGSDVGRLEALFDESSVGNTFVPPGLDPSAARALQEIAHRAVAARREPALAP